MRQVRISDLALEDLRGIWDYVADYSPESADRFIDRLLDQCDRLAAAPGLGRPRPELGKGLRSFAVSHYLIVYRASDVGIEVARVVSCYRDLKRVFRKRG